MTTAAAATASPAAEANVSPQPAASPAPATAADAKTAETASPSAAPPPAVPAASTSAQEPDLKARVESVLAQRRKDREMRARHEELAKERKARETAEAQLAEARKPKDAATLVRELPADAQVGVLRDLAATEADRKALEDAMAALPEPVRKAVAAAQAQGAKLEALEKELNEAKTWRTKVETSYAEAQKRMEAEAIAAEEATIYGKLMGALQPEDLGMVAKLKDKDTRLRTEWNAVLEKHGDEATPDDLPLLAKLAAKNARERAEAEALDWKALLVPTDSATVGTGSGAGARKPEATTSLAQALEGVTDTRERRRLLLALASERHSPQSPVAADKTPTATVPVQGGQPGPATLDPEFAGMTTRERARALKARRRS